MRPNRFHLILFLAFGLVLYACGGGSSGDEEEDAGAGTQDVPAAVEDEGTPDPGAETPDEGPMTSDVPEEDDAVEDVGADTYTPPPPPAINFLTTPPELGVVGSTILYKPRLAGVGDTTFTLVDGPEGMSIDEDGILSWTPSDADDGEHEVRITATRDDDEGTQAFVLIVKGVKQLGQGDVGSQGGTVSAPALEGEGEAAVDIPAGALDEGLVVTIGAVEDAPTAPALDPSVQGTTVAFGPSGTSFEVPVTVKLPIPAALRDTPERVAVLVYDEKNSRWEPAPVTGSLPESGVVLAEARHFSLFQTGVSSFKVLAQPRITKAVDICAKNLLVSVGISDGLEKMIPVAKGMTPEVFTVLYSLSEKNMKNLVQHEDFKGSVRLTYAVGVTNAESGAQSVRMVAVNLYKREDGSARVAMADRNGKLLYDKEYQDMLASWDDIAPVMHGAAIASRFDGDLPKGSSISVTFHSRYDLGDASESPFTEDTLGVMLGRNYYLVQDKIELAASGTDMDCDELVDRFDDEVTVGAPELIPTPSEPVSTIVDKEVALACAVEGQGATAEDVEWSTLTPGGAVTKGSDGKATFKASAAGAHKVTCGVSGPGFEVSQSFSIFVEEPAPDNEAPICTPSVQRPVIHVDEVTMLLAIASDDTTSPGLLAIEWGLVNESGELVPDEAFSSPVGPQSAFKGLEAGVFTIGCRATDPETPGPIGSKTIEVVELTQNLPPTNVKLIAPATVDAGETVTIAAMATDPEHFALDFEWEPSDLINELVQTPTASTVELTAEEAGAITVTVTVSDGQNAVERSAEITVIATSAGTDADGDHFPAGEGRYEDCDDEDILINPAADEICGNDVDEDCDGVMEQDCGPPPDADGDYVPDEADNCPEAYNASQTDLDGDGLGDACDDDDDGDEVLDADDNCPYEANPGQEDWDNDGEGDACDPDAPCEQDEDCDDDDACTMDLCGEGGTCMYGAVSCSDEDPCTIDACFPNLGCMHDDIPGCFPDGDHDGVPDDADNCPDVFNPQQEDADGDEIGDACDCMPDCEDAGKECGDDGCGGSCGHCGEGQVCVDFICDTAEEGISCLEGFECVLACEGDPWECYPDCRDQVRPSEEQSIRRLFGCMGDGVCEEISTGCAQDRCAEQYEDCAHGCQPSCSGVVCGDDGCGGSCGECAVDEVCDGGECRVCEPYCGEGRQCGDDGCGGTCGECAPEEVCEHGECRPDETSDLSCIEVFMCLLQCETQDESCTHECQRRLDQTQLGSLVALVNCFNDSDCDPENTECIQAACSELWAECEGGGCERLCDDKQCGDDGCGGSCGECPGGEICVDYYCQDCDPECAGRDCGDDGCGGSCGECSEGMSCQDGTCVEVSTGGCAEILACLQGCEPHDQGCAQECTWAAGESAMADYNAYTQCLEDFCRDPGEGCMQEAIENYCRDHAARCGVISCVSSCDGKECGDDGCGGSCGECASGMSCQDGVCEEPTTSDCPWIVSCVAGCGGEAVCEEACIEEGGPASALHYRRLQECLQEACPQNDAPCIEDALQSDCVDEALPCIEDHCEPIECGGKECGDDGCGGSCGECPAGQACHEWRCVPRDGLSCAEYHACFDACLESPDPHCDDDCNNRISAEGRQDREAFLDCVNEACEPDYFDCERLATARGGACYGPAVRCGRVCEPECGGKQCGDDRCGDSCGECEGGTCNPYGLCVYECEPNCDGKECGDDECNGSCGECIDGWGCNAEGVCEEEGCVPQCRDKECGDDGCGSFCGVCGDGWTCNDAGQCEEPVCEPECGGKECGEDGCGGTCGECAGDQFCNDGYCDFTACPAGTPCEDGNPCTANDTCEGGECVGTEALDGMDCDDLDICTTHDACRAGICMPGVPLNCDDGDECTTDICDPEEGCRHEEIPDCRCEPDCSGKDCGDDGCGGSCGTCPENMQCSELGTCEEAPACAAGAPCDDGNLCTENDQCDGEGGCGGTPVPDGRTCDDGDHCTTADMCVAGVCEGTPEPGCE